MDVGPPIKDFLPPPEWFKAQRQKGVKVIYNQGVDVLRLQLNDGPVSESDESVPGVILDYDAAGKVVGIELLDASKRSANPRAIEVIVND